MLRFLLLKDSLLLEISMRVTNLILGDMEIFNKIISLLISPMCVELSKIQLGYSMFFIRNNSFYGNYIDTIII